MATERVVISGFVKNSLNVPQGHAPLPEGTQFEIVIPATELPPELQDELEAWERAGDETWAWIDRCERQEPSWPSEPGPRFPPRH